MNAPAFINVVIPFDPLNAAYVNHEIEALTEPGKGNYPSEKLDAELRQVTGLHFMTLSVAEPLCPAESQVAPDTPPPPPRNARAHLVLEITSDYGSRVLLAELVEHFGEHLIGLLEAAGIAKKRKDLLPFLLENEINIDPRWFRGTIGQVFSGSPGLTVERIRGERDLAEALRKIIDAESMDPQWEMLSPRERLERVRNTLWIDPGQQWKWAFVPESALPTEPNSVVLPPLTNPDAAKGIWVIFNQMVWPLYLPLIGIAIAAIVYASSRVPWFVALMWSLLMLGAVVLALALVLGLALLRLKHLGATDLVDERVVSSGYGAELLAVENFGQQNHLLSVSRLKSGLLRRLTLRLAFLAVGAAGYVNVPGFLGKNGVIHAARWIRLPFTDQLMFWSNFDGTWESYVADFISDAPEGVTGIWSNCIGFPRTRGLFSGGATDGDRTVRWARRQQIPTRFWFAANRDVSAARIRTNSAIRQGLATAQTYRDCEDWFALFGSAPRPTETLQVSQISTLAFGGLSRMRHAHCFVVSLSQDVESCRRLLATLRDHAVYGAAHVNLNIALVVGLSAKALERLGLPTDAVETFPLAFKQGLGTEDRARALGDTDGNDPGKWEWGAQGSDADMLVLAYCRTKQDLEHAKATIKCAVEGDGHAVAFQQALTMLRDRSSEASCGVGSSEPFGFTDGISQPIIRGAPQRNRGHHDNDVVEPGELILGYPDNLGIVAPGPWLASVHDPNHLLPDTGGDPFRARPDFASYEAHGRRDIGMNGTYLVVRQYRQHVREFDKWFDESGFHVARAPQPGKPQPAMRPGFAFSAAIPTFAHVDHDDELRDLLFAKFFGRWKDGASLVRHGTPPRKGPGQAPRVKDNDFLAGQEDPAGHACPFGSHVRRANPRDTRFPGSAAEIASVNRHRMLRVSRVFGELDPTQCQQLDRNDDNQGVLFMCINGDIERQFEFVQKTWLLNPSIQGLECEVDPIVGRGAGRCFSIPTAAGPVRVPDLPDLTTLIGGGYFFIPSKALLNFLARPIAGSGAEATLGGIRSGGYVKRPTEVNVEVASAPAALIARRR
jgi:deferrochelatase/peroxidase EfeB